jgi:hypothetical protein
MFRFRIGIRAYMPSAETCASLTVSQTCLEASMGLGGFDEVITCENTIL